MAPVLCTAGNNGRAGGVGQAGAAAAVQHGVLFLTFLSPTACRSGGLAAQDREDRAAAGAVGGGVPRVQDLPPPDVGAGRAGHLNAWATTLAPQFAGCEASKGRDDRPPPEHPG